MNNEPAFPTNGEVARPGMTMRQYFTLELAKAMLIKGQTNDRDPRYFVENAIPIADALLAALEKEKSNAKG